MSLFHRTGTRRGAALAVGLALALAPGYATSQPRPQEAPLAANDVSWLFPPATADRSRRIAIDDLTIPDPDHPGSRIPVWSQADFDEFVRIAGSADAQVAGGARIGLPELATHKNVWFVAGVRIDAGAPGLDPSIVNVFGQRPQIRLILQPVLPGPDGAPQPQDIAAHLIFDFVLPEDPAHPSACPLHATPDLTALSGIVADAAALRDGLAAGKFGGVKVSTAGQPLAVHPGLANRKTGPLVTAQMKALLQKRLAPTRLNSMAIMGLPSGQISPWIFLSMLRNRNTGGFDSVRGPALDGTQFAMMLTGIGQDPRVVPAPHTNNQAPITCASGAFGPAALPVAARHGVATADLFASSPPDAATTKDVLDRIADPTKSHFFNTDCISCHTETRRGMEMLNLPSPPGLSPDVRPPGAYTVRNFGWSPAVDGPIQGTATRRTAAETKAVADWINANVLNK